MQQLNYLAEIFVLGGIASALVIAADLRACRQPMRIMNSVWILTGLWASFIGLWAYFTFGRPGYCDAAGGPDSRKNGTKNGGGTPMPGMDTVPDETAGKHRTDSMEMHAENTHAAVGMPGMKMHANGPEATRRNSMEMHAQPRWESVVLSTLHCGAGCTLADLVGEWFLYLVPVALGGSLLAGTWATDYVLALVFGIGFQYAAIRGMDKSLSRGQAVRRAAKADLLSLTAWQAGMYGWMAVVIFVLNDGMLSRTSFAFWFMMQIAMACGFFVALPVNVLLIRAGIKTVM